VGDPVDFLSGLVSSGADDATDATSPEADEAHRPRSVPGTLKIGLMLDVETPHGPARVRLRRAEPDRPGAVMVLGHGAGGGIDAPDLQAAADVALELGMAVALVEQPYRVAGRRSPPPAAQLDAAWLAVVGALRDQADLGTLPLIVGGRSSGARVACRTARATDAGGVLCLAFPVHPPGKPEKTRLGELDGVEVPVLVIQGERDPFGMPPAGPRRELVPIAGTHTLRSRAAVAGAVRPWLERFV
jgi:predicted alpha/beta-hydrolase family hydrolase